jgi:hypothetical protein
MTGWIGGMVCSMGTPNPTLEPDPAEPARRRSGASGTPAVLADGETWVLANPTYRPRPGALTEPAVDGPLDRLFESVVLDEDLSLCDLWGAARALLRANYDLTEAETSRLLSVSPGPDCQALADVVLEALFGPGRAEKTYTAWVRASLAANGLAATDIAARDVANVLAILVATNRTVPLTKFADACRLSDERARLETLL